MNIRTLRCDRCDAGGEQKNDRPESNVLALLDLLDGQLGRLFGREELADGLLQNGDYMLGGELINYCKVRARQTNLNFIC